MNTIEKKIDPEYFDAIESGKKKFELRLGDFDISEGDILVLREFDREKQAYSGRSVEKKVTYVRKFDVNKLWWPIEDINRHGLQIINLG